MSIIIEDKDDIELLLFFFEQFDLSEKFMPVKADVDADADLQSRINKIEKWTVEQADMRKKFARKVFLVEKKVNKIIDLLEEYEEKQSEEKVVKREIVPNSESKFVQNCVRQYSVKYLKLLPKIKHLREDGYFMLGNNTKSKYTIQDVLKLKNSLEDISLSFKDLGRKIGVSEFTARIVCLAIEVGLFDSYFSEWEQLQANQFYRDWKPPIIENNPQKRKENGMV